MLASGQSRVVESSLADVSPPLREAEHSRRLTALTGRMLEAERYVLLGRATSQFVQLLANKLNILPLIQLSEREYAHDPQLAELLGIIRETYGEISECLQQFKRVARTDQTDGPADVLPAGDCLREVAGFLRFHKGFPWDRLRLELPHEVHIVANRVRLHHILINLLLNAAEAIGESDQGRIFARLSRTAEFGVIEIIDNGPGIPAELQPGIWEPFFTTRSGLGRGLGLDIVQRLVRAEGGDVACRSTPGRGAVFIVRIPAALPETGPREAATRPVGGAETLRFARPHGPTVHDGELAAAGAAGSGWDETST